MSADKMVYHLSGKSGDGELIDYTGHVTVLGNQTLQQAADWRCGVHLSCLKWCLSNLNPKTVRCVPVTCRLSDNDALLQEAVRTVVGWHGNDRCRGGPYCFKNMPPKHVKELQALAAICDEPSWQAKGAKLRHIVASWPNTSSMMMHLHNQCYHCGKDSWKDCPCRSSKRKNLVVELSGSNALPATNAPSKKLSPVLMKRQPGEPMKRQSGKRVPKGPKKIPMKRRSGKSGKCSKSGAQRLKELGLRKNSNAYKNFKYGKIPVAARQKANEKYKPKRKAKAARTPSSSSPSRKQTRVR